MASQAPDRGSQSELPLVVQLGFAGSRMLLDPKASAGMDAARFHAEIETWLAGRVERLHGELGLGARHFFCGISQVAIGADTIFCRVCRTLGIPQRVFLPQHRDEYLRAVGSEGKPDFSPAQRAESEQILASPQVIQAHVASESPDRNTRFEEVNMEIAHAADFVICVARKEAPGKAGGTHDLIERAAASGKPVLEIRVGVAGGKPQFEETQHAWERFRMPSTPSTLSVRLSSQAAPSETPVVEYCQALKTFGSLQAKRRQKRFKTAAMVIIGTHVLATALAALALAVHKMEFGPAIQGHGKPTGIAELAERGEAIVPVLLGLEIFSLACGLFVHQLLHRSRAGAEWAMSRLVAELAYSVIAVGSLHIYLQYLFTLPFPDSLQPLLRTINVLHLKSTRAAAATADWEQSRDGYLQHRLQGPRGQINYYRHQRRLANRRFKFYSRAFVICSALAILATGLKLVAVLHWVRLDSVTDELAPRLLGLAAIVLPTVAVGALSLAAALDLEAREHTYAELHKFLLEQEDRLKKASKLSFPRLVLETESQLLAETANWFSRRSFTGVA